MKQKTNIRISVQDRDESAHQFAERIEKYCEDLTKDNESGGPCIVVFTSDGNGRQTANVQWATQYKLEMPDFLKNDPALFDADELKRCYDEFKLGYNQENSVCEDFLGFLLEQKRKD